MHEIENISPGFNNLRKNRQLARSAVVIRTTGTLTPAFAVLRRLVQFHKYGTEHPLQPYHAGFDVIESVAELLSL